jgi:hypothetical protein
VLVFQQKSRQELYTHQRHETGRQWEIATIGSVAIIESKRFSRLVVAIGGNRTAGP